MSELQGWLLIFVLLEFVRVNSNGFSKKQHGTISFLYLISLGNILWYWIDFIVVRWFS